MTKANLLAVRALLTGWARWKTGKQDGNEYLSPPNLIYRLMTGDVGGGGGFGSVEPLGVVQQSKHNPTFQRLDYLVSLLPKRRQETICIDFLAKGTQKDKAQLLGISLRAYEINLNSALNQIFADDFVKNLINRT